MSLFVMAHVAQCQGCRKEKDVSRLVIVEADGNQCRYCDDECMPKYKDFLKACESEEKRLNTLLDVFITDTRKIVTLAEAPQDFPRRAKVADALDGLRLG